MSTSIGVIKEHNDKRVMLDPDTTERLVKLGVQVRVQKKAGESAHFTDDTYKESGAELVAESVALACDIVLAAHLPQEKTYAKFGKNTTLITQLHAHNHLADVKKLQAHGVSVFALELIPRITRAQSMDVLSSQAASAGYRSALNAASLYNGFFPMLTTAAGTIRPVKAVVVGAGVAGLQAIATCKRLGAIVEAYDIRPAAKEQVESLGAKMIDTGVNAEGEGGYARALTDEEKQQQADVLATHIAKANVVITTAAIPGKPSPKIVTTQMIQSMQSGSVVVDLAAEGGGNCEATVTGQIVEHKGVIIDGSVQLPSSMSKDASHMFAKNIYNFLSPFIVDGVFTPDKEDEVLKDCLVLDAGTVRHAAIEQLLAQDTGGAQ